MGEEISIIELIAQRRATYSFLSRLFLEEVDEEFLGELCKMRFPKNSGNENIDDGYRLLHNYLAKKEPHTVTELRVDYVTTFIGQGVDGFAAAYPFESVHTSPKRLRMQEAREDVCAVYRQAGIVLSPRWKEEEDHIALELEFMQILCQRTLDDLQNNDEENALAQLFRQYEFLKEHLLNWVPMLAGDMQKYAKTDFYQGVSLLLYGFLQVDLEFFEELFAEEIAAE